MKTVYEIMHGNRKVAWIDTQGRCKIYYKSFMPFSLYLEETENDIDTLVNNVKELLDSVQGIPSINIRQATKDNLEQINRMYDECRYSMRTLQWIKEDLLKEDNKDA